MIEYIAKFYNEKNNESQLSYNIRTLDIATLYEKENIDLVVIEKQITNKESKTTHPVLIIYDTNKWNIKKTKYLNQPPKTFISKYTTIPIKGKCRQIVYRTKEELIKKLEKIQKDFYFMDNSSPMPDFEEYKKNHPNIKKI